jgi:uncharacterized membrane protein YphA (DoxX/SURF4 family)
MRKKLFTSTGFWENGTVLVRVLAGIIITIHGWQVFDAEGMNGYAGWLSGLNIPAASTMAYLGKWAELVGGVSLILGLLTRWLMIPLIITMVVIIFMMGQSDPLGEDQHPFLLLLIFLFYCLAGPGKWSLDHLIFDRTKFVTEQKDTYANTDSIPR